jgi:hypothetical protein
MPDPCAALTSVFQTPPSVAFVVALTTNGYGQQGGIIFGSCAGALAFIPGQVFKLPDGVTVSIPAQFAGQLTYSFGAPDGEMQTEEMNVSIIQPGAAGYALSLKSQALSGSCGLVCSANGTLLSGVLNDNTLVSVTFESPSVPGGGG